MMQVLYNSDNYSVAAVEFAACDTLVDYFRGGYEILDKLTGKGIYLEGDLALKFQQEVQQIANSETGSDGLDAYLQGYADIMHKVVQN